jgi:hypothetical protein
VIESASVNETELNVAAITSSWLLRYDSVTLTFQSRENSLRYESDDFLANFE